MLATSFVIDTITYSGDKSRISSNIIESFNNADYHTSPYPFWLLDNILPMDIVNEIGNMPFVPPANMDFNGTREVNNSLRIYFTKENQEKFPVCSAVVEAFNSRTLRDYIEERTGADLSEGLLRIEYCQDTDGFWLEPHTDISVKKFTMLIYISDDEKLSDSGTDIYEGPPDFKWVGSAPFGINKGLIFIPGKNTWHGFSKRPIKALRKSIIINYVSPEWKSVHELS